MAAAAVAVVVVVLLADTSEGSTIKAKVEGLLNAEEIYKQLILIEVLMDKLVNQTNCTKVLEGMDEDEDGGDDGKGPDTTSGEEEEAEKTDDKMEEDDDDKCDYAKLNENHTMLLPPNPDCKVKETGITDKERDLILSLHNELRALVAQGNESRGDPGPQPEAANMHQLVWNDELAKVAQAWASQCPSDHDMERRRRLCSRKYRTGQNINYYWGTLDQGPDWQKAIDNWYNEVADVAAEVAGNFIPHKTKKIGHYTQLVWGTTKEIGCGIVYYETERHGIHYTHSITYVCNYGPAGNILKRPFYKHGPPASNCPGEVSEEYPDLCL